MSMSGGRFDFDDGGTYCGGWEAGKAHGQGVCTGPSNQGEYAGSWNYGFEVLGVYTWPSGNTYEGNWSNGKRHNLGVETKGKWQYKGEWSHGLKGRYGVRCNTAGRAKYEGTWSSGLQDGYGTETYGDGGTYQGQWTSGRRHGSGVRQSMPYGMASIIKNSLRTSMSSLRSDAGSGSISNVDLPPEAPVGTRGGFVLTLRPHTPPKSPPPSKKSRLFRKDSSALRKSLLGGLLRSKSNTSIASDSSRFSHQSTKSFKSDVTTSSFTSDYQSIYASEHTDTLSRVDPTEDPIDVNTIETYYGEWKDDSRTGYGVCERTDGFRYEGEWLNNQRCGYGRTTFPDSTQEEGKYKFNAIVSGGKKNNLIAIKLSKIKTKVSQAVDQAQKAKETAKQKADIASSRTTHSVAKAKQAELAARSAREEAKVARCVARDLAPDFYQPGLQHMTKRGEDPFKEMENAESMYLADRDRNDVAGPESYHQFVTDTNLVVSPVASRSGSMDAKAMNLKGLQPVSHNQSNLSNVHQRDTYQRAEMKRAVSDTKIDPKEAMLFQNEPSVLRQRKRTVFHENNLFSKSVDDSSDNSSHAGNSRSKMSYLSPESARFNRYESAPSIKVEEAKEGITGSERTLAKTHKPSFFRSFRSRRKKTSLQGEPPPSTTMTNPDWRSSCAEDKRKAWQKSMSSSDRFTNSQSKSLCDTFDYESKQTEYLSGYEAEMTHCETADSSRKDDLRDHSIGHGRTASYGYSAASGGARLRHTQERRNFYLDPVLPNRVGERMYPSSSNLSYPTTTSGYQSVDNASNVESLGQTNSLPRDSCRVSHHEKKEGLDRSRTVNYPDQGHSQFSTPGSSSSTLSVSTLRPRDGCSEKWQEAPTQCTPAFAHFSSPSADSAANKPQKSISGSSKLQKQSPVDLTRNDFENEDDFFRRDSLLLDENSKSPLPGNLRRRHELAEDSTSTKASETDATKTCMIILVILLNIGFLALFAQFLT